MKGPLILGTGNHADLTVHGYTPARSPHRTRLDWLGRRESTQETASSLPGRGGFVVPYGDRADFAIRSLREVGGVRDRGGVLDGEAGEQSDICLPMWFSRLDIASLPARHC